MLDPTWLTDDWDALCTLLPDGWRAQARTTRALQRSRQVQSADELLRLLLLHIGAGLSLRQTVLRAALHGLPALSDVALLKRLRCAADWLRWLCTSLLEQQSGRPCWRWLPKHYRLRAVDSTTVQETGSTGTDWRVHYSLALPSLCCEALEVTGPQGGESLCRFTIAANDLMLADRGYCRGPQLRHVLDQGGHFAVRWHRRAVPLLLPERRTPLDVLAWLRTLRGKAPAWRTVRIAGGAELLRVCALRVSPEAAARELARVKESARNSGRHASAESMELSQYIVLLTSLPAEACTPRQVLELFRLRWQIELAFKRLKSLLHCGHVPKTDPASARAWLQGKMLTTLLIERLLQESELFSPWGFPLPEQQPLG